MYQIGETAKLLGISADTLRYYEKIGLLPHIARTPSGLRNYTQKDISRIQFIKRAQSIGFTLDEISQLLSFREAPQKAKPEVRKLANEKLKDIRNKLDVLQRLHDELQLLSNLCVGSENGCPILENLDDTEH